MRDRKEERQGRVIYGDSTLGRWIGRERSSGKVNEER